MTVPLVLLPGSLCDERLFAAQLGALDVPCQVADLTLDESIETMAERVINDAPQRFALAGLSLGGIVAAEIAERAPHRLAGVALIDTNLSPPDDNQLTTRRRWAADVRSGLFAQVVEEILPSMSLAPATHGALIADMAMSVGPAGFLNQNEALLHRHDRRSVIDDVTCPVLVACGAQDSLCPPALHAELADRAHDGRLAIVEQAGHLSTIDQPERLTEAIGNWLKMCNNNQPRRRNSDVHNKA